MCLIIASETGLRPSQEILTEAATQNPDGFGIMHPDASGQKIAAYKGFQVDSLLSYLDSRLPADTPFVIHFRYATHGRVNVDNTHPFRVHGGLWMAHNGILSVPIRNKGYSDTWHFAQDFVKPYMKTYPDAFENGDLVKDTELFVGRSNKIAYMATGGRIAIANRSAGVEREGCWYSNDYSFPIEYEFVNYGRYKRDWKWQGHHGYSGQSSRSGSRVVLSDWFFVNEFTTPQQCDFCDREVRKQYYDDITRCWVCDECAQVLMEDGQPSKYSGRGYCDTINAS